VCRIWESPNAHRIGVREVVVVVRQLAAEKIQPVDFVVVVVQVERVVEIVQVDYSRVTGVAPGFVDHVLLEEIRVPRFSAFFGVFWFLIRSPGIFRRNRRGIFRGIVRSTVA
jgi:hypothetical protein|tara:strand:- start:1911 stop:2246 length:336 start_codon:yes stop_codon:yes gene_type:complete